jgi:glyoxylase-like metal-dependent hydrolase (beta-lactamase superfamily II)
VTTSTTNRQWAVGDATVTSIVEAETYGIPPQFFFPDATVDDVRACDWLDGYASADGNVSLAVQAFLVELPSFTVLVDPCVGNGKQRALRFWHDLELPWFERFLATGVTPDAVDLVLHTHLHADHVGWDTHCVEGEWVPTFVNARHVYVGEELDYWRAAEQRVDEDVYADSVEPIVRAGAADVVGPSTDLGHGLRLVPTPGHTPGHVSVEVTAAGETLMITGDLLHHPMQFAHPHIAEIGDYDAAQARETRRAFMDEHARRATLLACTHFAWEPFGRVEVDGAAWRFVPDPGLHPR